MRFKYTPPKPRKVVRTGDFKVIRKFLFLPLQDQSYKKECRWLEFANCLYRAYVINHDNEITWDFMCFIDSKEELDKFNHINTIDLGPFK